MRGPQSHDSHSFLTTVSVCDDSTFYCSVQVNIANVSFWRLQPMAETQRKELSVSSQQFRSKKVQAVSGDKHLLALGLPEGHVVLLDLLQKSQVSVQPCKQPVTQIYLQADKNQFFSCHGTGAIYHYKSSPGDSDKWVGAKLLQEKEAVSALCEAEGTLLVTSGLAVKVYDLLTKACIKKYALSPFKILTILPLPLPGAFCQVSESNSLQLLSENGGPNGFLNVKVKPSLVRVNPFAWAEWKQLDFLCVDEKRSNLTVWSYEPTTQVLTQLFTREKPVQQAIFTSSKTLLLVQGSSGYDISFHDHTYRHAQGGFGDVEKSESKKEKAKDKEADRKKRKRGADATVELKDEKAEGDEQAMEVQAETGEPDGESQEESSEDEEEAKERRKQKKREERRVRKQEKKREKERRRLQGDEGDAPGQMHVETEGEPDAEDLQRMRATSLAGFGGSILIDEDFNIIKRNYTETKEAPVTPMARPILKKEFNSTSNTPSTTAVPITTSNNTNQSSAISSSPPHPTSLAQMTSSLTSRKKKDAGLGYTIATTLASAIEKNDTKMMKLLFKETEAPIIERTLHGLAQAHVFPLLRMTLAELEERQNTSNVLIWIRLLFTIHPSLIAMSPCTEELMALRSFLGEKLEVLPLVNRLHSNLDLLLYRSRLNGNKAVSMLGDPSNAESEKEERKRATYVENRDKISFVSWADIYGGSQVDSSDDLDESSGLDIEDSDAEGDSDEDEFGDSDLGEMDSDEAMERMVVKLMGDDSDLEEDSDEESDGSEQEDGSENEIGSDDVEAELDSDDQSEASDAIEGASEGEGQESGDEEEQSEEEESDENVFPTVAESQADTDEAYAQAMHAKFDQLAKMMARGKK